MNKKFLCLFLALLLLTACAGKTHPAEDASESETASPQPTPSGPTVVLDDPSVIKQDVTVGSPFYGEKTEFRILGLERYDSINGDYFTDTPDEGCCYLALFLSAYNDSDEDVYIDPDEVRAVLDGTDITNTFLLNDPKGYPSFFNMLHAWTEHQGFIVWEVPSDWQTLTVEFGQWKQIEKVRLQLSLTPEDYLEASKYGSSEHYH